MIFLGNQASLAPNLKDLRAVLYSNLSLLDHVSQVIKSTRGHTRDLYRNCRLLDIETSLLLANTLICSRLDYCNSLFASLTDFALRRLQVLQNTLYRVVTHSSKFSHITAQLENTSLSSS